MKKLLLPLFSLLMSVSLQAQNVSVNNDGTSAAPSAMLDVKSTNKGFLMPRVTTAQRTTIPSPALGLLVFDTDTKTVWAYDGASWKNLYTSGGGLILPFTQSTSVASPAFNISNTSTAIQGTSTNTSTAAIRGTNNSTGGFGVYGTTTASTGTGVFGQTDIGTGVTGFSSGTGVGVKAISTNGLALQVNGNVKIAGGNTNPSNGAVLTSDAEGNAVWKANRVAFRATGINSTYSSNLATDVWYKVIFPSVSYDVSGNFSQYAGSAATADASVFSVPVNGIYHFDANLSLVVNGTTYPNDFFDPKIRVAVTRNGTTFYIDEAKYYNGFYASASSNLQVGADMRLSVNYYLLAGDKVFLQVYQYNPDAGKAFISSNNYGNFSGHLVMPD